MSNSRTHRRGRPFAGGLACFTCWLLLALVTPAIAQDIPSGEPPGLEDALARIDALLARQPLDLDQVQYQYLVLFENFPRHEAGKRGIFALYHLLRQNKRIEQAYAVLIKILSVYQDNETMNNPADARRPIAITATANVELAHLYATGMNNPYQALDTLKRALLRTPEAYVESTAADRNYFGSMNAIARLQMADYLMATDGHNQACNILLAIISTCPGERVRQNGLSSLASVAAVRRLPAVLAAMPASLPKKERIVDTFAETVVEREARIWLLFVKAEVMVRAGQEVNSPAPLENALAALEQVVTRHSQVMITSENGEEPAGVRALRTMTDIAVHNQQNIGRACADLTRHYSAFSKVSGQRVMAAYCLFYLAQVEHEQRHNPAEAYRYYMEIVDKYPDVPFYPHESGGTELLRTAAQKRAYQARQEM